MNQEQVQQESEEAEGRRSTPRRDRSQKKSSKVAGSRGSNADFSPLSAKHRRQSSRLTPRRQDLLQEPQAAVMELTDSQLEMIYSWVDRVPQARPKKNIMRDFSDGNQIAHIIRYYLPLQYKGIVQVHNYIESSSKSVKVDNWTLLNQKVLSKLKMHLSSAEIQGVVNCQPLMIETILFKVKKAIEMFVRNPPGDFSSVKATEYVRRNLAKAQDPRRVNQLPQK